MGAPGCDSAKRLLTEPILALPSKFPDFFFFAFVSRLQNLPRGDFPCSCKLEIYVPERTLPSVAEFLAVVSSSGGSCEAGDAGGPAL